MSPKLYTHDSPETQKNKVSLETLERLQPAAESLVRETAHEHWPDAEKIEVEAVYEGYKVSIWTNKEDKKPTREDYMEVRQFEKEYGIKLEDLERGDLRRSA